MKCALFFSLCSVASFSVFSFDRNRLPEVDSIFVSKAKRQMTLFQKGVPLKIYTISIGENDKGHKVQQGDNRTPEGLYFINDKNPHSRYFLNLGISYPNAHDKAIAVKRKVSAGGDIKIHGYADKYGSVKERHTRFASTWGCIGVCNAYMQEIFAWVKVGIPILIVP